MTYARIRSGAQSCDTTKARFHDDIECSPRPADGFLELVNGNAKPSQPDEYIQYHLEVVDGKLVKTYSEGPIPPMPPPPKRYSKMKFTIALARRGILAGWDEFASATELLPGLTVKRVLDEATWMQSDDANFTAILDAVKVRFGAEVIDAVLAESEDEEW